MNLEEQISQMNNPQEFVRLCNTILTELHPIDYQVIDGTRSDEGNDGYLKSEKTIFAIYCPIKPEKIKDSDYLSKIRSDIKKASKLRDIGKYEIENWAFITPRKLSNKVIAHMNKEGDLLDLNVIHLESTFLANFLKKNPHLLKDFNDLRLDQIDKNIEEILNLIKDDTTKEKLKESDLDKDLNVIGASTDKKQVDKIYKLRTQGKTKEIESKLRSIYYQTSDKIVKINAIIGMIETFMPIKDDVDDYINLCNEGIAIAEKIESYGANAYLLAKKGFLLSYKSTELDFDTAFKIKISNTSGFPIITQDQIDEINKEIFKTQDDYNKCFEEAINITKKIYDYNTMASIFTIVGTSAGHRAHTYIQLEIKELETYNKEQCKTSLMVAKDIYSFLNDEHSIAYVLYNLANYIRFFGEEKEALELIETVIQTAEKYSDQLLLNNANELQQRLETGEIPNHLT